MHFPDYIARVPDFPKPGILFYDIAPLLANGPAWSSAIRSIASQLAPHKPDLIVGIESRGFLVAAPLSLEMGIGFAMVRKSGKLPGKTIRYSYSLEYGEATLEIQKDMIQPGLNVVIVDDILATGGTMCAAIKLLEEVGATVKATAYLIELKELAGRAKLRQPAYALMQF